MTRKNVVESIVGYFKSDQWHRFMQMLTQTDDPMYHMHIYVENSIHPESLRKLFTAYHKLKGIVLDRGIQFSGLPGVGMFINVQPVDSKTRRFLANYELFWFYNPDVLIGPAEIRPDADLNKTPLYKDVQEDNLWGWGKKFMDDYYKQFDFKCVGPHEEAEIREYFKSDHFKKWLRLIDDSPADHIHCNVDINFDPWILKMYAVEALEEVGLKIDWVVPNVFRVPSGLRGKLIFLCAHPEWQHDITWGYNPDVVIRPATKPCIGQRMPADGDITFDFNLHSDFEASLAEGEHVKLTDEEINEILARV
ncbi:MAG: hypothetical protein KKD83_03950 [Chloroflexi bacterium]|nr:hypothetical protein [Chloroflexota bacterium]